MITILTLFTGIIGINLAQALREQKFSTEVDIVLNRLRLAQNLMLIMNRDVDVIVEGKGDEGIEIRIDVEGGLPKKWATTINHAKHLLTTIHLFQFKDPATPRTANKTIIRFYSGGTVMSRGVVRLSTHANPNTPAAITKGICLRGYPHPIIAVAEKDGKIDCPEENTQYDERLTLYTVEELNREAQPEGVKLEDTTSTKTNAEKVLDGQLPQN